MKFRTMVAWMMAAGLVLAMLAACGEQTTSPSADPSRMTVMVSLPVFVSMAEAVAGDHAIVRSIVPAGVDPHTYQPRPSDAKALANARAILINGFGLEGWLSALIESSGGAKAPVYELARGLTPIDDHADENAEADGHNHEEGNPHFWLNPEYASHYVDQIAEALSEQDPANAADYEANAAHYRDQIQEFDVWAKEQIDQIPAERRKIVTFHDAYPYFGEHFGLEIVGVVVTSPGREPSSRELAQLVDTINQQQVTAIFSEPQFNPKLVETLAKEAAVRNYTLYSDTPAAGDGYLEMMRKNISNVVEGLR